MNYSQLEKEVLLMVVDLVYTEDTSIEIEYNHYRKCYSVYLPEELKPYGWFIKRNIENRINTGLDVEDVLKCVPNNCMS